MDIMLALIQFALITVILIREVQRKSPGMFMWATLFLMFGAAHLWDVLTEVDPQRETVMEKASMFVLVFCIFYIVTRELIGIGIRRKLYRHFSVVCRKDFTCNQTANILLTIFVVASLSIVWKLSHDSGGLLATSWANNRAIALADDYISFTAVCRILFNALGGILAYSLLKKEKINAAVALVCILFVELITRDRVLILPLLVSIISIFVFRMKHIRLSGIFLGLVGAITVIYIVYAIRAFRWTGTLENAFIDFSFAAINDRVKLFLATSDGELGLRKWFYYFIEHNNQFTDFGEGHTYLRMLLVYIPTRFSLGIKPNDFAKSMGAAIGMSEGGSMHPTLFGDCYANLGIFGVLFGIFWAIMVHFQDTIILKFKHIDYEVLAFVLFGTANVIMARGAVYNGFVNIAWGIPILIVSSLITARYSIPRIGFKVKKY